MGTEPLADGRAVNTDTGEVTEVGVRPFAAVLHDLDKGRLASELSEELAALAAAVTEEGRSGTLTLVLKLSPHKSGALFVTSDVKAKRPTPPRPESILFADLDGNLTRTDPRQETIPGIRPVK